MLDFDGDEINIHVPQTIEAYAEAEQLLGIYRNLMSAQTNKPMMGIVYDTLSGAYLITYPQEEFERLGREIIKCYSQLSNSCDEAERTKLENTIEKYEKRRLVVGNRILIDPLVFNISIENVKDAPQYNTLFDRLDTYSINPRSGRALISSVFPEDFDYRANGIVIKDGILVSGVLTKDSLGNKDGSIIAEMVKQKGGLITVDFMSDIQFVVKEFLAQHGLSVGIDDCIPDDLKFRQEIEEIISDATLKVISLSNKVNNKVAAEQQERKICEALDIAKNNGDSIVQKFFKDDNSIMIMAKSGAKGTTFNAIQMSSALGPTKVSGKRIQANLPGDRALPSVEPGCKDPRSKGYIVNSFGSGLTPMEFFFHSQGGREGLTDTAVNTAQTGFLQHQIIKSAEDIHISPDGSVRSADLAVVQFIYGDDGQDASNLSSIKIQGEKIPFFRDISTLAEKINRRYASGALV